jgi:hypothetical protein
MGASFAIIGTSLACKRDRESWECKYMIVYDIIIGLILLFALYYLWKSR